MKNTLIDAGPIIALFNNRDRYHGVVLEFLKEYDGILTTSWPVMTEASHMLDFHRQAQIDLLEWARRGGLKVEPLESGDIERLIKLSEKYADLPMDLADASLVVLSERLKVKQIVSIDSDFYRYRTWDNEMLENILVT